MGEPLDLLAQPVGIESLDRFDDSRVECAPAVGEDASVRHLVRQRVFEGVFELGEEVGLVQELRGLELGEVASKLVMGHVGDRLQHHERHIRAHHGGRLEHGLLLGGQAVDPGGEERLHRGRHLDGIQRLQQAVVPTLANEHLGLDKRPHPFLEEERRSARALDEERLQRPDRGVIAEQAVEKVARAGHGQRIDPELPIVRL